MSRGGHPVTRTLWLVRHAKATTALASREGDHERPLAPRGRRDAAAFGALLPSLGIELPGTLVCSDARRTVETAGAIATALGLVVDQRSALYGADPSGVLEVLREFDDGARSAMVVGHNPALQDVAWGLCGDDAGRRSLSEGLPTCACAVFTLGVSSWVEVSGGSARLVRFLVPPYGPTAG